VVLEAGVGRGAADSRLAVFDCDCCITVRAQTKLGHGKRISLLASHHMSEMKFKKEGPKSPKNHPSLSIHRAGEQNEARS